MSQLRTIGKNLFSHFFVLPEKGFMKTGVTKKCKNKNLRYFYLDDKVRKNRCGKVKYFGITTNKPDSH